MRQSIVAFALLLVWQAPVAQLAAQTTAPEMVSVELSNFKFSPSELTLQHSRTYRLHLVNAAGGAHDFTAPEFFAASTIAAGDRALVAGGKVKLAGHQSVDITLTPVKSGTFPLHCSHFMHSGMGMSGQIVVQ